MIRRIDAAKREGNTLGGICEVVCDGLPVGLGSHVSWDRKLERRRAAPGRRSTTRSSPPRPTTHAASSPETSAGGATAPAGWKGG
jgi:hypothetical protein